MLKNKIITLNNGDKYYIGEDITFDNGEHYCSASLYNEKTQDCDENFRIFKIENNNNNTTIIPEEDMEMARYVTSILVNKNLD